MHYCVRTEVDIVLVVHRDPEKVSDENEEVMMWLELEYMVFREHKDNKVYSPRLCQAHKMVFHMTLSFCLKYSHDQDNKIPDYYI